MVEPALSPTRSRPWTRLGNRTRLKSYVGAQYPLLQTTSPLTFVRAGFRLSRRSTTQGIRECEDGPDRLVHRTTVCHPTRPAELDAVTSSSNSAGYPHEVTIIEIRRQTTNLALAIRKDPSIVPLVRRSHDDGGSESMPPGNAYPTMRSSIGGRSGGGTQIVLRAAIPLYVIPLRCTNKIRSPRTSTFRLRAHPRRPSAPCFATNCAPFFGSGPPPY